MLDFLWGLYKITILYSVCCWVVASSDCIIRYKREFKRQFKEEIEEIKKFKGNQKRFPWTSLLLMLPFVICPMLNIIWATVAITCRDKLYEKVVEKVREELSEDYAVMKLTQLEEEKKEKVEEVNGLY